MRFLLDTSVLLWARTEPERLNRRAEGILRDQSKELVLSAASVWEISVKYQVGKLPLPEPPAICIVRWMQERGIRALEISHRHALGVGELPPHHQDPFDRMLIAQAQMEGMTLLTADRVFERYGVAMIWCGT